MKQYVVDQLRESDRIIIKGYLRRHSEPTALGEIFWVHLPMELYTPIQREHKSCQPFYFAVNLSRAQVAFELLVRSCQVMRCPCIGYASQAQRDHIINFADRMLDELQIKV